VALSATVDNSDQLTDWLNQVHGPTDLIYSDYRPVPLDFHFGNSKGLFPLLNEQKTQLNHRLVKRKRKRGDKSKQIARQESPDISYVLQHLRQRDMLPAIYFIFSRRGCDRAVAEVGDLWLVDGDEAQRLRPQIDEFLTRNPDAGRAGHVGPLYRGIAAHHAGILPAWKALVEELFQQGLIKVVFATETLAAGINMPARTTVISTLSKRTDSGHRLLNPSEFLQMAGRAGRRGMDEVGYVVTLQTPFEGSKEAGYLATSHPDPLVSQFSPSYGMVLNLLQTHTLEEAKELIERSFGQYLATLHLQPQYKRIAEFKQHLVQIKSKIADVSAEEVAKYEKLRQRLKVERKLLTTLQEQAAETRKEELSMMLSFAVSGTLLSIKGDNPELSAPITAVLVGKTPGNETPFLVCLGKNNRWYVNSVSDVIDLYAQIPRIDISPDLLPPSELLLKPGESCSGDEITEAIAAEIPETADDSLMAPEVVEQLGVVTNVQQQLESSPLYGLGNAASIYKRQTRAVELEAEIQQLRSQVEQQSQRHWDEFITLIEILQYFEALNNLVPSELGQMAAAIRGENELWLGLVLNSGNLDGLAPHHFATAIAALVTETSRPDSRVFFELSDEVADALASLRPIRRKVFQLQRRYGAALPVWLEFELITLVEQWALGMDWVELCENTTLDEGDVVRILRRTLDLLSQIPHVPHLPQEIKRNAQRATQLIDRFPVNEVVE
ncbi:MAG: helicase-related protein, partial [Cyanobacteria bacterium J06632_19]